MPIQFIGKDGKESSLDIATELKKTLGDKAYIKSYNKENSALRVFDGEKTREFILKDEIANMGGQFKGIVGDLNTPETAQGRSPLSIGESIALGITSRESGDMARTANAINALQGNPEAYSNEEIAQKDARAIAYLKQRYDDAKMVNGALVVKDKGVWKPVDKPSWFLDIDAGKLLGNQGLNIVGAMVGQTLIPIPGIGAIVGSSIGEVAEELIATGIAGGGIDYKEAAKDIAINGIFESAAQLLNTGITKGATKVGELLKKPKLDAQIARANRVAALNTLSSKDIKKVILEGAENVREIDELINNGAQVISTVADDGVKDSVSGLISAFTGGKVSAVPVREAIDTPWKWLRMKAYTKVPEDVLQNEMRSQLIDGFKVIREKVSKDFGDMLHTVGDLVSKSDFEVHMDSTLNSIRNAGKPFASEVNSGAFIKKMDPLAGMRDLKRHLGDIAEEAAKKYKSRTGKLIGRDAVHFIYDLHRTVTDQLDMLGAYTQRPGAVVDHAKVDALSKIEEALQSKLNEAVNRIPEAASIKKAAVEQYASYSASARIVQNRIFSEKGGISFAQQIARGQASPEVNAALKQLSKVSKLTAGQAASEVIDFEGGKAITKFKNIPALLESLRLKQAAIEYMGDYSWGKFTTGGFGSKAAAVASAAAVGNYFGGDVGAVVGGGAALGISTSPAFAMRSANMIGKAFGKASQQKMLETTIKLSKPTQPFTKLTRAAIDAVKPEAKSLMSLKASASWLKSQQPEGILNLLKSPEAFNELMKKMGESANSVKAHTPENVTNAVIQTQQGEQQ